VSRRDDGDEDNEGQEHLEKSLKDEEQRKEQGKKKIGRELGAWLAWAAQ
jgi:hypothetical protein